MGYAILTAYMTFATIFLAIKGVQQVAASRNHGATSSDLFMNAIFRDVVVPLSVTVGSYVVASIIHMDLWHIVTSFMPYILVAPSHINILNVFAFANVHDILWGTKGDSRVTVGVAKTSKGESAVEVVFPTPERNVNAAYEDAIDVLLTKPPKEEKMVDTATAQEDYYREFSTSVLMAWVLSNALLVAVILITNGSAKTHGAEDMVNGYMIFILYSVAFFALVRFIGSTMYMVIRLLVGE